MHHWEMKKGGTIAELIIEVPSNIRAIVNDIENEEPVSFPLEE